MGEGGSGGMLTSSLQLMCCFSPRHVHDYASCRAQRRAVQKQRAEKAATRQGLRREVKRTAKNLKQQGMLPRLFLMEQQHLVRNLSRHLAFGVCLFRVSCLGWGEGGGGQRWQIEQICTRYNDVEDLP